MAAIFEARIDDPQLMLDTWGAGAALRWEVSEDDGDTWAEVDAETILATKRRYILNHRAGDDETLCRVRPSSATPATDDDYGAYSDVRPVEVDTIDATPGGAEANAYLTVAAADVLATDDIGPEAERWLASEPRIKAAALKRATREIDAHVATGWPPYDPDQALTFPREDLDVDAAGDATIPQRIRLACYQQAIFVLSNRDELAAVNAQRTRGSDADPDAAYGGDPGPSIMSPLALHYLAGFRTAPRSRSGRGLGSVRVSSGFVGTR